MKEGDNEPSARLHLHFKAWARRKFSNTKTRVSERFERSPIAASALLLAIVSFLLFAIDLIVRPDIKDIVVEAHGLVFDLILFGIVILAIDLWRDRRERTARHIEELDDYRTWQEPEAAYRIAGLLRRLLRDGHTVHDLRQVYLANANLSTLSLWGVDLSGANLEGANLAAAILGDAQFERTNLRHACLTKAALHQAKFQHADLSGADLRGAGVNNNDFSDANLVGANLSGLNLNGASFERAVLHRAKLVGTAFRGRASGIDLSYADLRHSHFGMVDLAGARLEGIRFDGAYLHCFEDITGWTEIASIRNANVHAVMDAPDGYWHRVGDSWEDRRRVRSRTPASSENVRSFYDWALGHGAVDLPWKDWLGFQKSLDSPESST